MFIECADRENCKVYYGFNGLLQPWACYFFEDAASFEVAHGLMRILAETVHFETMESLTRNGEQPGGVIYVRRPRGGALTKAMTKESRTRQLQLCLDLAKGLALLHQTGGNHGALDEDNVILDEVRGLPIIQEYIAEYKGEVVLPPFRAPEQWQNRKADKRTDVYQFAVGYLSKIKAPSRRLKALISHCMEINPEKRPKISEVVIRLEVILGSETMESVWPNWGFSWKRCVPYAASLVLLGLLVWSGLSKSDKKPLALVIEASRGDQVKVVPGHGANSFAAFANALTVVTGKPVTYPSSLAARDVIHSEKSQKWEEVLSEMGLGWEIQIVKAKPTISQ